MANRATVTYPLTAISINFDDPEEADGECNWKAVKPEGENMSRLGSQVGY